MIGNQNGSMVWDRYSIHYSFYILSLSLIDKDLKYAHARGKDAIQDLAELLVCGCVKIIQCRMQITYNTFRRAKLGKSVWIITGDILILFDKPV